MENLIKNYLANPQNLEIYFTIILALFSGLIIRIFLSATGQRWVTSYHQTLTYVLLPVTTLIITKVIAGNIALSLGMIGALSIVRFRNPVKSSFELTMFFSLITIGIAMGVNYKWGVLLTFIIVLVILFSKFLEQIFKKIGKNIYTISFDEGNEKFVLEINSQSSISEIEKHKNIIQISKVSERNYFYRMVFKDEEELNIFKNEIINNEQILSFDAKYNR